MKETSQAAKRGIQAGDIITQVGETPVENAQSVIDAVEAARKAGRKFILLRISHGTEAPFVTLPIDEPVKK